MLLLPDCSSGDLGETLEELDITPLGVILIEVVLPDCSLGDLGDTLAGLDITRVGVKAELALGVRSMAGTFMGSLCTVGDCLSMGRKPRGEVAVEESLLLLGLGDP